MSEEAWWSTSTTMTATSSGSDGDTVLDRARGGGAKGTAMVETVTEPNVEPERAQSYVIFRLGGEEYALEVMRVQEVLDIGALTKVPGGPRSLRGVLNLRGKVVPVYDLRVPFELPVDEPSTRAPSVLMVESSANSDARVTGLLVERVSDVLEFTPEEIQPAPQLGLGKSTPFVRGLIRHQEGFLLVLDVDRVFTALGSLNNGGGF
jgi:purine-binding chemotaxis protein CheW